MGVGKTALTRGFADAFAVSSVRSPTYTVVNEYKGDTLSIFHFDLYRLEDEDDLYSIGFDDYLAREGLILCEWTEKIPEIVPNDAITVSIRRTQTSESDREIDIRFPCTLAISL
jgi:tRNA threonylcarbamoyladenosine biosynthesis protein TsaE